MHLLNTKTLRLAEFFGDQVPQYAILSHTWDEEEVTFQDIQDPIRETRKGFAKISSCCAQARKDELEWVWIDTCCIDKSSSAELSEAINSMYQWYRDASVCYVYLSDVRSQGPFFDEGAFGAARWFTRGWCLQELIAPSELEFYANDWTEIGTKSSLKWNLTKATGIPLSILIGESVPADYGVAERMSWASKRKTSRIEDTAYCLLGIFSVNMPLLYGEGSRAMLRLQEEILRHEEDHSIFLWQTPHSFLRTGLFCDSPSYFSLEGITTQSGKRIPYHELEQHRNISLSPPVITARGLRMDLLTRSHESEFRLAWTYFKHEGDYVCMVLGKCASHTLTYERVMVHCVYTLDEKDLLANPFVLEHVYLPPFYEISIPRVTSDYLSFKIHLHSAIPGALSILDKFPNCELQHPESDLYTNVFSLLDCPGRLALLIGVRDLKMDHRVVLVLRIFGQRWRCLFRKYSENTTLQHLIEKHELLRTQEDDLSDRAIFTLPTGSHVVAAAKIGAGLYRAHITLVPQVPILNRDPSIPQLGEIVR